MSFDLKLFRTPPAKFRGAPFWALNHDLTNHDRLREQIDAFAEMGIGGYHLHVRAGLQNDYLGEDFLAAIHAARDYGASKGMLSYLYDEDTWPSGFAGGAVTKELKHRRNWVELQKGKPTEAASEYRQPVCAYRIELDSSGRLVGYERVDYESASEDDWFLTHVIAGNTDRYNGASYSDTLNPAAIRSFIDSTHEVYLKSFGGEFPEDVPSIFTDEPNFGPNAGLATPFEGRATIAWTYDLRDTFREAWDVDLLDIIPEIIWPKPDGPSVWRWRFRDHTCERFTNAYTDQLGQWCEDHGIAFTGHMLNEDTLPGQAGSVGECMRHYRSFQIPGIDLLCDAYLPATVKQAVSVARQDGREQVMSELYGVTNWDFPFAGHKAQGDWQAALGINLRIHHLSWISMEGQSKRDYPAAIGPQSPWYKEYPVVEDHFARVGAALSSGRPLVRIGVIHPIESVWLDQGISSLEGTSCQQHEVIFKNTVDWLLEACLDFDFIAESLLPDQERPTDQNQLQVGEMAYDVILVPSLTTIRKTTLESLSSFIKRGGKVVVMGSTPACCDGALSNEPAEAFSNALHIPIESIDLLNALEPWREIDVVNRHGHHITTINHQLRTLGGERILYCSNRQKSALHRRPWAPIDNDYEIRIRGNWQVVELDTTTGKEAPCAYTQQDGWTTVPWKCHPQSHRLLRLTRAEGNCDLTPPRWSVITDLSEPISVTREEPNVLILDRPEWRVSGEAWQAEEDSQMAQLKLAERFGWPDWSQPYSVKDAGPKQRIERRFKIHCDADFGGLQLMCERLDAATISLDGKPLPAKATGWWVDHDLPTMPLPDLVKGEHTLEIALELDAVDRHLEYSYLLGDFDVATRGAHAKLVKREPIFWGDAAKQGLPFYGGNIDYQCEVTISESGQYALRCPNFGGALLRVWCNEEDCGPIAYAPYRVALGELPAGQHHIRIRCYGNRMNTFGALHNNRPEWEWWGPPAWRLEDEGRNDVWQLRPTGLTRAPMLERLD